MFSPGQSALPRPRESFSKRSPRRKMLSAALRRRMILRLMETHHLTPRARVGRGRRTRRTRRIPTLKSSRKRMEIPMKSWRLEQGPLGSSLSRDPRERATLGKFSPKPLCSLLHTAQRKGENTTPPPSWVLDQVIFKIEGGT